MPMIEPMAAPIKRFSVARFKPVFEINDAERAGQTDGNGIMPDSSPNGWLRMQLLSM